MAEITLKQIKKSELAPFVVNLENDETNETVSYKYWVKRLGGKAAMQVNLILAEFARDKQRDQLLGASMMKEILSRVTRQEGTDLEVIDLFDLVDDEQLQQLATGLIEAAKSSSVSE